MLQEGGPEDVERSAWQSPSPARSHPLLGLQAPGMEGLRLVEPPAQSGQGQLLPVGVSSRNEDYPRTQVMWKDRAAPSGSLPAQRQPGQPDPGIVHSGKLCPRVPGPGWPMLPLGPTPELPERRVD